PVAMIARIPFGVPIWQIVLSIILLLATTVFMIFLAGKIYRVGSFTLMNNPDGPLGFWLSIIPFTSPVAMIARIPFGVPIWQIVLSIILLLATTVFMI
ncbi:ABC transporter permease, partial [Chryseobacterium sp. CH1]|uniref:ABC transporter permease n=1 Tax=Chryseobacterium sp. CH1 TaxID=713551 RepID=UPI001E5619F3